MQIAVRCWSLDSDPQPCFKDYSFLRNIPLLRIHEPFYMLLLLILIQLQLTFILNYCPHIHIFTPIFSYIVVGDMLNIIQDMILLWRLLKLVGLVCPSIKSFQFKRFLQNGHNYLKRSIIASGHVRSISVSMSLNQLIASAIFKQEPLARVVAMTFCVKQAAWSQQVLILHLFTQMYGGFFV